MTRTLSEPELYSRPADKPMPPLPQDRPAKGNAVALVLCDSRQAERFARVQPACVAALQHMGVPYRVYDLGGAAVPPGEAGEVALIVLGQEGLGPSLRPGDAAAIVSALASGVGLLSLDPHLAAYPAALRAALPIHAAGAGQTQVVRIADDHHFITAWRDKGETEALRQPVATEALSGKAAVLAIDEQERGLIAAGRSSAGEESGQLAGRFVWFGVSPLIWLYEWLGHGWGLDDLFWRSIGWAARKPFAMKAMPPMATMRFDDCHGTGSLWWLIGSNVRREGGMPKALARILTMRFAGAASVVSGFDYVRVLNEFGWKPEVSLFVDQVSETDWAAIKRIYDQGNVQLSAHAFADAHDDAGKWWSHFIYHKGVEVERDGKVEFRHSIGPKHLENGGRYRVVPYSTEEVEANFLKLDEIWARRGIVPGRTPNTHWRNPSSNTLGALKARGRTLSMWGARYNYAYPDTEGYAWRALPYGDGGFNFDYMPIPEDAAGIEPTDFFNAQAHAFHGYRPDALKYNVDYCREGAPIIEGLHTHRDPELIARTIARHAKLGLQGLFFACPMSHEMNLATFTREEWTQVVAQAQRLLGKYPREHVLYDEAAQAARDKCMTHLDRAEVRHGRIVIELSGETAGNVYLYHFRDDDEEGCRYAVQSVGAFGGSKVVVL